MDKKYFVVSPPRSGTKSLTKMANICGLKFKHSPVKAFFDIINDFDFFADTPVYCPTTVEQICNTTNFEPCFIYIEKDFKKLYLSWKNNLLLAYYTKWYNTDFESLREIDKFDFLCYYKELFNGHLLTEENCEELFWLHKKNIVEIALKYDKQLLMYNFGEGWDPFCRFINQPIPNIPLPHLNKNTLYDSVL